MPLQENRVKYLNTYIQFAPVLHREMIRAVAKAFKGEKGFLPGGRESGVDAGEQKHRPATERPRRRSIRQPDAQGGGHQETRRHRPPHPTHPRCRRQTKSRIRQLEKEIRAGDVRLCWRGPADTSGGVIIGLPVGMCVALDVWCWTRTHLPRDWVRKFRGKRSTREKKTYLASTCSSFSPPTQRKQCASLLA